MNRSLASRAVDERELMDDPDCDSAALDRTYRNFRLVNSVVAGWRPVYRRLLRPLLSVSEPRTLLDVGSGGGDVPRALARWAARDGLRLRITAIDPDDRAHAFATRSPPMPGLAFRQATSSQLVAEGRRFDFVTSNHLLHHLTLDEFRAVLEDCERLGGRVVHSDIRRSRLAYAAYSTVTWRLFPGSFIHDDGRASIRRSFTSDELRAVTPAGWRVQRQFPYRNLLVFDQPDTSRA